MTLAILFFDGLRQFIYSAIIGGIIWDFIKSVLIIFYKLVKKAIKNFRLYSKHTHSFRLPEDTCARDVNNIGLYLFANRDEIIRGILIVL